MKIQIDFDNQIIRLEDSVNLKEFFDRIKLLLPDGEWKDYILQTNTIINEWKNPIYIPYNPYPVNPWWDDRKIWCNDSILCHGTISDGITTGTVKLNGTYNFMDKQISFCISTHNNLNYLKLCIESIQENVYYQDFDLLIYAEGCEDGTNEYLDSLSKNEPRLKFWVRSERWNDKYWGIGGGLNWLAEHCETKYFLPLHSDMYVGYHFDKELLRLCSENEKSVISSYRFEPDVFNNIKDGSSFLNLRPGTTACDKEIFGYVYSDFKKHLFTEYSEKFQHDNNSQVRKGEGAGGFIIRTEDWIENDSLFAPASYEDTDLFIRMQLLDYKFILTSKSLIWHFGARSSHFPTDDFSKTSDTQIKREQENAVKWLTKWNKLPENDYVGFVSSKGMKINDNK